jgi:xanthine dehydrogenase small subunit
MTSFILNNEDIATDLPAGVTVLDFVRYHKDLKGTKIGCREGDCGACTILVGELIGDKVRYRSMTSCLMPLANAAGKHIVTIEGINPPDGSLTPVQQALVDESGTQCGFCTVGFVISLTGFCLSDEPRTPEAAVSAIDGNICRCTGYKSIERAARRLSEPPASAGGQHVPVSSTCVPPYFTTIAPRLRSLAVRTDLDSQQAGRPLTQAVLTGKAETQVPAIVGGGTDLYVQRHDQMAESEPKPLLFNDELRSIRDTGTHIEIGASATVTDLLESPLMNEIFPDLYKHLKLVSSTPIRNMATLAGNFVNASPIGDMTVWFLALDAEIDLCKSPRVSKGDSRTLALKDFYLGYKQLAKQPEEIITAVRFRKSTDDFRFNFEKVCKRTYLDIATVNTAISIRSEPPAVAGGLTRILSAHMAAGGVAPIPLYLNETSAFLVGKEINEETIELANEKMQSEIAPISDVRGTEQYKRLLLRQLFRAHFAELFATENSGSTEESKE